MLAGSLSTSTAVERHANTNTPGGPDVGDGEATGLALVLLPHRLAGVSSSSLSCQLSVIIVKGPRMVPPLFIIFPVQGGHIHT